MIPQFALVSASNPPRTRSTHALTAVVAAAFVVVAAHPAAAAFTSEKCLIQKRQAWAALRKCEASEDVKRLKRKATDLAKCRTKFQQKLAKIDAKAVTAVVACRYGANGDGTVTDYDTALMWEAKDGEVGGVCLFFPGAISHCVNLTFGLEAAQKYVGQTRSFLAGYDDWRLPSDPELEALVDPGAPGCGSGAACIDPIFGPTLPVLHWTTTFSDAGAALVADFDLSPGPGAVQFTVRAVRTAF